MFLVLGFLRWQASRFAARAGAALGAVFARLALQGHRVFHAVSLAEVQDHLVIGTRGAFVIRVVARRPQLRPRRHQPDVPRRTYSISRCPEAALPIPVPPLVSGELFAQAAEQLAENQRRARARKTGVQWLESELNLVAKWVAQEVPVIAPYIEDLIAFAVGVGATTTGVGPIKLRLKSPGFAISASRPT